MQNSSNRNIFKRIGRYSLKMVKPKAIVCLPTYNEAKNIEFMIGKIKQLKLPVFVSDQNSNDGTQEIAKKNAVPVYQREGNGKGCGVQTAIKVARQKGYDFLVLIDCDKTYPTEMLPKLLSYIKTHDMVIGARSFSDVRLAHRLPNRFLTLLINILYGGRYSDINSGMRVVNINKLGKIDAKGFDIEAQICIRALKRGLRIKDIPVSYSQRRSSKIRLKDGFVILWRILKEL
jgi:dolichol-phosphate mannosyltransferase